MADTIRSLTVKGKGEGLDGLAAQLRAVQAAQLGLVQSGAALDASSDKSARRTADAANAFNRLMGSIDPVIKASNNLEAQVNKAFRAFDQGIVKTPQLNATLEKLFTSFEKVAAVSAKVDQSAFNNLMGVSAPAVGAAQQSAAAFEAAYREAAMLDAAMAAQQQRMSAHMSEIEEFEQRMRAAAAAVGPSGAAAINQRMGVGPAQPSSVQFNLGAQQPSPLADKSAEDSAAAIEAAFNQEAKMLDAAAKAQQARVGARDATHDAFLEARDVAQMREFTAEQDRLAKSAAALKAALQPLAYAEDVLANEIKHVNELMAAGAISSDLYKDALTAAQSKFDNVARNYGGDKGANASKLAATQFTNLGYQLNDIISGLAMGQAPLTILTQQGGQVYQALASARGGVVGGFQAVTATVTGFLGSISPVVGVMGGLSAAALAAALAYGRFASAQREVRIALAGAGRATGATAAGIDSLAQSDAPTGMSVAATRAMYAEFARTGKIGMDMYADLGRAAKNYAVFTGDLTESQKEMTAAFADPAKGAETLNEKLGGLDATTRQQITNLTEQGNRLGAQRVLMDAFGSTIQRAAENTSLLSRAWQATGATVSNITDRIGRGVANALEGGSNPQEQLETARKQLESAQRRQGATYGYLFPQTALDEVKSAQAEIARLTKLIEDNAAASEKSKLAARSLQVDDIVKGLNPGTEALRAMENKAINIRDALKEGVLDPNGDSRRTMDMLLVQAKQLKSDMAAGGAAYADSLRAAAFAQRTVGFSPGALSVAQINENAATRSLQATREAGSNTQSAEFFARLQSIEQERVTQIATAAATAATTAANQGGAFSRMTPEVQQRILAGQPTLAPSYTIDQIAAVFEKESSGRLNMGLHGNTSTAYGIGGMTVPAETDIRRSGIIPGFDRTNPATAIEGSMAYLQMRANRAGGDVNAGLNGYGTGPGYAADVNRRAGTGGQQSTLAVSQTFDENSRAVREANANVDINTRLLGVNGEKLDAQTRLRQLLAEAEAKGIPVGEAYRQMLESTAGGLANAAQRMKMVSFANDIGFEREQLGRSAQDQAIYSRVRGQFGDTTSETARTAIAMAQANDNLKITKDLATGMFQGIGQDLMNGAKAADAFHNAFTRMASKLLDMSIDNIMSKMFGALTGGGGGLSNIFGAIGGGASGSGSGGGWDLGQGSYNTPLTLSANGNIMTSSGPLPLNRYAKGGIANRAQVSIFGEGRQPEAYVPLPDGRSIPVSMRMDGAGGAAGGGQGMQVQNVVHNYGNDNVSTKTTMTPKGPRNDIVIGKAMGDWLLSPEAQPTLRKLGVNRAANGR